MNKKTTKKELHAEPLPQSTLSVSKTAEPLPQSTLSVSKTAQTCIICGEEIPEGRIVCPICEKRYLLDTR